MRLHEGLDVYEYIAVCIDDLALSLKDSQAFIDILTIKYKFNLKGTGPLEFHLGCDFPSDENGVFCMAPRKYIEKMVDAHESMLGEKPRKLSPLPTGDHPEMDVSEFLMLDAWYHPIPVTKWDDAMVYFLWTCFIQPA
jgi:hypothetical protein